MILSADERAAIGARITEDDAWLARYGAEPDHPELGGWGQRLVDRRALLAALVAAEARERENAALYHGAAHHLAPFGQCDDPVCTAYREAGE